MDLCSPHHDDDHPDRPGAAQPTLWRATWVTGPDAGGHRDIGCGRHVIGRAHTAALRCDDPQLQPHHALLEVCADGTATVLQLTGRVPIIVAGTAADGLVGLTDDTELEIGGSVLHCTRRRVVDNADPTRETGPGGTANVRDGALLRSPRTVPTWSPIDAAAPQPPLAPHDSVAGLVPALLGVAGAALMAWLLHQVMFLLFGAMGGTVAVISWVIQHQTSRRARRRAGSEFEAQRAHHERLLADNLAAFRRHHLAAVPTVPTALDDLTARSANLWGRRAAHPDAFMVSVGVGPTIPPTHEAVLQLPVPADLGPGARLAVRGPNASASARAVMLQVAASCGPADLRIIVVSDRPADWDCVRALPHLALPDGTTGVVAEVNLAAALTDLAAHHGHLLFVTDQPNALATRTSPLRRALGDPERHALIAVLGAEAVVPHLCTSVLTLTSGPVARWVTDTRATMLPTPVRFAGAGPRTTAIGAAALRGLIDPEDPLSVAGGVPRHLALSALLGDATPMAIAHAWQAAGPDPSPRATIGMAADGIVDIDLVRDGPHGLIAGTTGAGKSELLRSLVAAMATAAGPAHLSFVLVDYKGGATFDACAALPHVVGVITDLDDQLADRALRSLHAELRRREGILRDHGAADLTALRGTAPEVLLPRLVVVIDEFAALVAEQPGFLHALVGVAQRGRSLGVHLLLATQRPNGVISDDIRANTNLRIALRLQDTADAIDVVGIAAPAQLPRGLPGRAVVRLGADDHVTFQTAHCTGPAAGGESELQLLVRAVGEAARLANAPTPPAPWQPPLPTVVRRDDCPPGAVGVIDDPDHQRTLPLHWSPEDGHLLVAGSAGAGVTSTLFTLATTTLQRERAHVYVYVLDGRGDDVLHSLAGHPRCGAVVRLHERERMMRLLHQLATRCTTRGEATTQVVLFVDGLDAVRRTLDDLDTAAEFDALETVLADGETAGITVVAGVEQLTAVPAAFLARCPHRWVLHLHEAHDGGLVGLPAAQVPRPGVPGRLVVAGSGLVAQVVEPGPPPLVDVASRRLPAAPAIPEVPAVVHATLLTPAAAPAPAPPPTQQAAAPGEPGVEDSTRLTLGLDFATGATASIDLPDGEHLLIVGGARTGRTSALTRVATAWRAAHPTGWVAVIAPRRTNRWAGFADSYGPDTTVLDGLPTTGRLLLLVDDAEAVDDPSGRLAACATARPHACVVAAGRPEALRQAYGHWTGVVRRSRTGIVLTGGSEVDGDLFGATLPRRTPIAPRPGLAWSVVCGAASLTQLAVDPPDATSAPPRRMVGPLAH